MFAHLVSAYHLHPIVDHFTIALLAFGIAAEIFSSAAILLSHGPSGLLSAWSEKLRSTSLLLMIAGAISSVLSYFSGDAEADRLSDSMSPAAQQILASSGGAAAYLSHAVLGQYLMYAFLILAAWRVIFELSSRIEHTRVAFLLVAAVAVGALLYQGKTGGELVYDHGVGMKRSSGKAQEIKQPHKDEQTAGSSATTCLNWRQMNDRKAERQVIGGQFYCNGLDYPGEADSRQRLPVRWAIMWRHHVPMQIPELRAVRSLLIRCSRFHLDLGNGDEPAI